MFNGENRVLQSVNSLFAELWIKLGLWDDFEEYLVNSLARVANAGAMEALAVSESSLASWCWFGCEQHAEVTVVCFLPKVEKTRDFGLKMDFWQYWRVFGMTSPGGVGVG